MTNPTMLHAWTIEHLAAVAPDLLESAAVAVALPRRHTSGGRSKERWFWNVREESETLLFVALDHAPIGRADIVVAECYRVPRPALGDRKVVARYRVKRTDRVGSFLDQYRVTVPKAAASSAAPAV